MVTLPGNPLATSQKKTRSKAAGVPLLPGSQDAAKPSVVKRSSNVPPEISNETFESEKLAIEKMPFWN